MKPNQTITRTWQLLFTAILLPALLLGPSGLATQASAPPAGSAQQSGWGLSLEMSYNWDVKPASADSEPMGLDFGCWGAYANGYGDGLGTPRADGTISKWGRIDETGQISGGCWIKEGDNQDGRLMKGSLSGTFAPATQAISKIHLETTQIITNTIDGKTTWWMDSMVVEGTGEILSPPDTLYSHRVNATATKTSQGNDVAPKTQTSKVSFRVYISKIEQLYRLSAEQIANNPNAPFYYQPASYRFTLEKKGDGGQYEPLKKENVKISNVWTEESVHFLTYFQATNCQNCVREAVGNQVFYRTEKVPDDISIQTDEAGQFTISFFPNLGKLAKAGIFPSPTSPLSRKIKAAYYGTAAGAAPLTETFVVVKLEAIGIIEWLGYQEPGLYDANGNPQPLRWPKNLSEFVDDPGTQVESWKLSGVERVRLFRAGEGWFVEAGQPTPGKMAAPGTLLTANTDLVINACDLDKNYGNSFANQRIYKPGSVRVRLRFFDGVSAMVSVNSEVCSDTFNMGVTTSDLPETQTIDEFMFQYLISLAKDKGIEIVAEKINPYYQVFDKLKNISEAIELIRDAAGRKSIFVRLNSQVLIETNINGEVRVTTREGKPVIITEATGGQGITVEAGQTARITDSLVPTIEKTDPETAKKADQLLKEMAGGSEPAAEQSRAGGFPLLPILLAVGGAAGCGMLGITGAVIGAVVWRRKRKLKAPARQTTSQAKLPTSAKLIVNRGTGNPSLIRIQTQGLTIGRDPTNLLELTETQVSRYHARIEFGNGTWFITDLNSANGSFVNGGRVQRKALKHGDQIQVGQTRLIFQMGE